MSEAMRINKYLSTNGYCSRREADRLVELGRVFINDEIASLGDQIFPGDEVRVIGRDRTIKKEKVYILVNKPPGILTSPDINKRNNITSFVDYPDRIYPVGHLDTEDAGLVLLTNDEILGKRLIHPDHIPEEEYVVEVDHPLTKLDLVAMQNGIVLEDGKTAPTKVRLMNPDRFAIILERNKGDQIRRMCDFLGYDVVYLMRTRIGTLKIPSSYPEGSIRHLAEKEVRDLKKLVGLTVRPSGGNVRKKKR
ncbi:23S rRNA pseudouridine synthase F [Candidatus Uhrbacteria bacterium CG10_big_fil_rev_8_21_14_0_10_48_16]|uniref:23S rRNA pseudouridine synthase F n=1 Tax=Candidatus Uhrbacteria bacterium CG10_big_fil_rev_8_21_14_0_10_48_16 TaxID=1975038 RepID=A0A2M8LIG9_9BACT|nr:MAG: 23S rRNA pseudouridine synthase F [Candidatus Uhrbacteria bacterium CG10_big_fil_rev_8_21_14_0_10_48_16]